MRIPVPRNRLVAFTLVGALLSATLASVLAAPGLTMAPLGLSSGQNDSSTATNSMEQSATTTTRQTSVADAVGSRGSLEVEKEGPISIDVAGSIIPGNSVVVTTTRAGEPVANALVTVNGHVIGRTDAKGQLSVPVPEEEFEVRVEGQHTEGRLEVEWEEG